MNRSAAAALLVLALTAAEAVGVAWCFGDDASVRVWHDVAGWAGAVVGVAGTLAAALAFSRGDWMRKVWAWLAASAVLLLAGTLLRSLWVYGMPDQPFDSTPYATPRAVVVAGANAMASYAFVLLSLTYYRSGLRPKWTAAFIVAWIAVTAGALSVGVPPLVLELRRLSVPGSAAVAASGVASTLGDIVTIVLIAPIVRVAYLMRRGRLAWVWWMMGLSGVVYLLYDAREPLAAMLPGNAALNGELLLVLRTPGLALAGLAGWLQREAFRAETS